jgi:hypothetical protein
MEIVIHKDGANDKKEKMEDAHGLAIWSESNLPIGSNEFEFL